MYFNKSVNKFEDYSFEIASKCVSEGKDEFNFVYNHKDYTIGVCSDDIMDLWDKRRKVNNVDLSGFVIMKVIIS